mmetsp:Transcript_3545/g.10890  ORF Transcript_3545/g.10890 Transcript_3545/m.10890 type:complete len:209 (-) Transcript_3545:192-818(-)
MRLTERKTPNFCCLLTKLSVLFCRPRRSIRFVAAFLFVQTWKVSPYSYLSHHYYYHHPSSRFFYLCYFHCCCCCCCCSCSRFRFRFRSLLPSPSPFPPRSRLRRRQSSKSSRNPPSWPLNLRVDTLYPVRTSVSCTGTGGRTEVEDRSRTARCLRPASRFPLCSGTPPRTIQSRGAIFYRSEPTSCTRKSATARRACRFPPAFPLHWD